MPVPSFPDEWLAQSLEGLTPERLQALRAKSESGRTLWECLVAEKIATDAEIIDKLSHRFRLKVADTSKIDLTARDGVPEQLARRYRVLPLRLTDSFLELGTSNPFDLDAEKALAFATAREIRLFLLSPSKISEKLDEMYRADKAIDKLLEGMGDRDVLTTLSDAPAPAGRPRARRGQRPADRLARFDAAGAARRKSRDPHPRFPCHGQIARLAGPQSGRSGSDQAAARKSRGHPARHRADRLGQNHDAVLRDQSDQERRRQHRDGRRPGRVPDAGDRSGAGAGESGTDIRRGAAVDPAAGPQRGPDRGNPRQRDGADRRPGVAHRSPRALHTAHQRRGQRRHTPRRYRRRVVQDRRFAARCRGAAPDAKALPHVQGSLDGSAARALAAVDPQGDAPLPRSGVSRLRDDGLSRTLLDPRDPHDDARARAADRRRGGGGSNRGSGSTRRDEIAVGFRARARDTGRVHARRAHPRGGHPPRS